MKKIFIAKQQTLFIFTVLVGLISFFLFSRVPTSRVPPSVFAGYCGDGTCGAGEDCYNCLTDCPTCPEPPQPTPTPGVTPTPSPGGVCAVCGGGICSNGIHYDLICCCGWEGCGPCEHGNVVLCEKSPQCPDTAECTIPENCPNLGAEEVCGDPACNVAKKCIDGECVWECQGLPPCDGEPSGNVPPFILEASISPPSICQATPGKIVTLTATYGDNNGVGDLKRAYLGLAPCGDSGDAYCTNFERNLANYFGGVFYAQSDQVKIAVDNYGGTAGCTGGAINPCPWELSPRPIGSMSVYNKPGTVEVTNVSVSRGNFTASVTWTLKFHGVPANSYNIYAMVVDMSYVWQAGIGQPARWWDWYANFAVEECSISGKVYDSAEPGTTCSNLASKPPVEGAVVTGDLVGDGEYSTPSGGDGSYALNNISGGDYQMSAEKTGWKFEDLVCEGGTQITLVTLPPSKTNINIGISSWADGWYQSQEGDVHAEGSMVAHADGDIRSIIPSDCQPDPDPNLDCDPNFSLLGDTGLPGVVSYSPGGGADFGYGYCSNGSDTHWLAESSYQGRTYDYDYFYNLVGSPTLINDPDDTVSQSQLNGDISADGIVAYNGDIKTGSEWNMGSTKAVILINGKFLLAHRIRADLVGSIVIIAKDGIGVSENLIANGEGGNIIRAVFITDGVFYSSVNPAAFPGSFTTGDSDKKLVIDGAAIAWGNFNFSGRDFGDDRNNTEPIEFYRYEPSLLLNSNKKLWETTFTWQELAP